MERLTEIVKNAQIVLLDASHSPEPRGGGLLDYLYSMRNLGSINLPVLKTHQQKLGERRKLVEICDSNGNPICFTTERAYKESATLARRINQRMNYLIRESPKKLSAYEKLVEDELLFLHGTAEVIRETLRERDIKKHPELSFDCAKYSLLLQAVDLIEREVLPCNRKFGKKASPTDKEIIATALYLSLHSKFSPVVITGDGDLYTLLKESSRIFTSKEMVNYPEIAESLNYNPVRLYKFFMNGSIGEIDTSKPFSQSPIRIKREITLSLQGLLS